MAAKYSLITVWVFFFLLQLKRKRVGAGYRGSSNPFVAARDLQKPSTADSACVTGAETGGLYSDSSGDPGERSTDAVTSSIGTNAAAASLPDPTKASRALSKKQQKLADAAKTSRNISQYFSVNKTTEKSQEDVEATAVLPQGVEDPQEGSRGGMEGVELLPLESETHSTVRDASKTEVVVIVEEGEKEVLETQEQKQVEDTQNRSTTV